MRIERERKFIAEAAQPLASGFNIKSATANSGGIRRKMESIHVTQHTEGTECKL